MDVTSALPDELWLQVFEYLDREVCRKARLVCRRFERLLEPRMFEVCLFPSKTVFHAAQVLTGLSSEELQIFNECQWRRAIRAHRLRFAHARCLILWPLHLDTSIHLPSTYNPNLKLYPLTLKLLLDECGVEHLRCLQFHLDWFKVLDSEDWEKLTKASITELHLTWPDPDKRRHLRNVNVFEIEEITLQGMVSSLKLKTLTCTHGDLSLESALLPSLPKFEHWFEPDGRSLKWL